jgi:tetratricopeptide (TPR) repeat protein
MKLESSDNILSVLTTAQYSRIFNNKAVALKNLKYTTQLSILINKRKFDEAIASLQDLLKINPKHVNALNNLGDTLNYMKRYEEAIDVFTEGLKHDPNRLSLLYNKGNSYHFMKKYPESIEWYDRALAVQPTDVDSLANKVKKVRLRKLINSQILCIIWEDMMKLSHSVN